MVTLAGNVVRLEPLEPRHTAGLFEVLGNDEEAWRWMIVSVPRSLSDIEKIVESYLLEQKSGLREPFAVIEKSNGRVIGTTSFMDISKKDRALEIGSTIYAREFWRSAVNTETKYLLLTRAFEEMKCIRVYFKTDSLNLRSQSAISRLGATFEGTFRSHRIRADGTLRDSMYYSIIESEWPTVKSNLEAMLA
jgi:RimJ/RimL family protein N-acetyltransferase